MMQSEEEIAAYLADATGPVRVRGGGTRVRDMSEAPVLDVSGLTGITLYEPGALTLMAQAGTPLREVEATLADSEQRLAFEPSDLTKMLGTSGASTLGGVIATNASGPRRIQAGAARDFALGVRFVDGTGTVVKNGGRVMKNVTGYDLVKLMCGAWGTLGVLTEVSLKVLPMPEMQATLAVPLQSATEAVAVMSRALGSPYEVSGAAARPEAGGLWRAYLRLEGFETSVAHRVQALKAHLARDVETVAESAALWVSIRDAVDFAPHAAVWRVSVKPSDAPELLDALARTVRVDALLDWGGGLIWLGARADDLAGTPAGVAGVTEAIQVQTAQCGGHATLLKSPSRAPVFQTEAAPVAALSAGLRARFDPRGILNPGLMGA